MNDFEKLMKVTSDEKIELASGFKNLLHKWLVLGQTRYVCRHGTLSDGHDKVTDSQRYAQCIKEMYYLASNMRLQKAIALEAQADLMAAECEGQSSSLTDWGKLYVEAKIIKAKERLTNALVTVEDQMRMLDEYDKIRKELEPIVMTKYPEGIEQAEEDNWTAVARLKHLRSQNPRLPQETMSNVPLEPELKAKLGFEFERPDMVAPLIIKDERKALELMPRREAWQKSTGSPLGVALPTQTRV